MDFDVSFSKELVGEQPKLPLNLINSIEKTNEMIGMFTKKPQTTKGDNSINFSNIFNRMDDSNILPGNADQSSFID